jgi:hypothetical protein
MQSVVARNVVMWRMTVLSSLKISNPLVCVCVCVCVFVCVCVCVCVVTVLVPEFPSVFNH